MGTRDKRSIQPETLDAESDIPYSFASPESITVRRAAYDPRTQTLTVEFADSRYQYGGVDEGLWSEFLTATSKGKFFSQRIRPLYAGVRL